MPSSMRAQTIAHNKRLAKRKQERIRREKALQLLQRGISPREVSTQSGVTRTIVYSIRKAITNDETQQLAKLLDPENHFPGRRTVLTSAEQKLVVDKALEAAQQGFAVDCSLMKSIQGKIAAGRENSFTNRVPSSDAIRSFRARHRELAYRASQNVSMARIAAENLTHMGSLKEVILKLRNEFPEVLRDPRKIWNWDETAVCGEYGRKVKCFTSSSSKQGGTRLSIRDPGKHLTAGLAVAACGNVAPLFLIASGKKVMKSWLKPLDSEDFTNANGIVHWLCNKNWFPGDAELVVTPHGSIDKAIIVKVIHHINRHARKTVPPNEHILLFLDGHSSRQGDVWLEECHKLRILVIKLPANTTHLLQPCDQSVNRIFQKAVRSTRDELLMISHMTWANSAFKIKLAVAGYRALTPEIARKAFYESGLWPMDFRFLDLIEPSQASDNLTGPLCGSMSTRSSLAARDSHLGESRKESRALLDRIRQLSNGSGSANNALAEIQVLLNRDFKVKKLLDAQVSPPKLAKTSRRGRKVNAPMNGAQRLQARSEKETSKRILESVFDSENRIEKSTPIPIEGSTCEANKENRFPSEDTVSARKVIDPNHDVLDDIPIASWRYVRKSGNIGRQGGVEDERTEVAASGLVGLSHYR